MLLITGPRCRLRASPITLSLCVRDLMTRCVYRVASRVGENEEPGLTLKPIGSAHGQSYQVIMQGGQICVRTAETSCGFRTSLPCSLHSTIPHVSADWLRSYAAYARNGHAQAPCRRAKTYVLAYRPVTEPPTAPPFGAAVHHVWPRPIGRGSSRRARSSRSPPSTAVCRRTSRVPACTRTVTAVAAPAGVQRSCP